VSLVISRGTARRKANLVSRRFVETTVVEDVIVETRVGFSTKEDHLLTASDGATTTDEVAMIAIDGVTVIEGGMMMMGSAGDGDEEMTVIHDPALGADDECGRKMYCR
ncbi:unnamed protein product, partial [Symbiodinium pilosum]